MTGRMLSDSAEDLLLIKRSIKKCIARGIASKANIVAEYLSKLPKLLGYIMYWYL